MNQDDHLRFVPSRVEGLLDVTEVVVRRGQLELLSSGTWIVIRFADIAEWPRPRWLWRVLARFGRPPSWLPVGERDWFHPPPDRFIRFFSNPRIVVYMAAEPEDVNYAETLFYRVKAVMARGGFTTWDLG